MSAANPICEICGIRVICESPGSVATPNPRGYRPDGNLRNPRDFILSARNLRICGICVRPFTVRWVGLTRTRRGASLQEGKFGVRWEIWEYWELWEDWVGDGEEDRVGDGKRIGRGREEGGRGAEGEGAGEGCGVVLVSGWRAHCENREGAVAGARRSTGVSEPVRASSRCAARSHQAPSHGFSRALGLLVLLGLPKEQQIPKNNMPKRRTETGLITRKKVVTL